MTEEKQLNHLKQGSESALQWFMARYTGYVSTIVYNIIGAFADSAQVEEVTADVFFALWQHAEAVRPGHVQGYLAALARNKAKNKCRELKHTLPLEDHTIALDAPDPEKALQQKELAEAVRHCVFAMQEPDREIFLRFYFYYQTAEQIANELQMNLSTVKTKLRRGRERLKSDLQNYLL